MSKPEVKRYTTFHGGLHAAPEGEIVMWSDYEALAAENERLLKAGQALEADYSSYRREVEHKREYFADELDQLRARVAELEAFVRECAGTVGGMVDGNRLSRTAAALLGDAALAKHEEASR